MPTSHKHRPTSSDVPVLGSEFPEPTSATSPLCSAHRSRQLCCPSWLPAPGHPTVSPGIDTDNKFLLKTWGGEKEVNISHFVGEKGEALGLHRGAELALHSCPPGDGSRGWQVWAPQGALNKSNRGQRSMAAYFSNPRDLQDPQE